MFTKFQLLTNSQKGQEIKAKAKLIINYSKKLFKFTVNLYTFQNCLNFASFV